MSPLLPHLNNPHTLDPQDTQHGDTGGRAAGMRAPWVMTTGSPIAVTVGAIECNRECSTCVPYILILLTK